VKKKVTAFTAIRFGSWDELFSFGQKLDNESSRRWFYRGQSRASWRLESSLEREIGVNHGSDWNWQHAERWMLRKFRGFAHNYLAHPPAHEDLLEWLALMQHHGAPTRLLDCTFSFPVAAFFAAWEGKSDFAVWAFNWDKFSGSVIKRFGFKLRPEFAGFEFNAEMHKKANEFLNRTASGALAFPTAPLRSNERLEAQQGIFLFPCDVARTLKENLECLIGKPFNDRARPVPYDSSKHWTARLREHWVIKCILPKKERFAALRHLHTLNIHAASLFPGLDGFAKSLRLYAPPNYPTEE